MTQPTEYEQMTYNAPDGAQAGRASTERLGFWGATPISRRTSADQAAVTTTQTAVISSAASSGGFAYSTAAIATDIVTQLNAAKTDINAINVLVTELRAALVSSGIIHGS